MSSNILGADYVPLTDEEMEEATAVLAGCDPEHCSYPRGYMKRQAVFACNTCTPPTAEPAGICLACANKCHDSHEIFELYTKRDFRCDCGNNKFGDFQCQLVPVKDEKNTKNRYNENFNGIYCTCKRLCQDTEGDHEMIQCVICEDWFHSQHLGCTELDSDELHEMVCEACMNKASFLWTYAAHFAAPSVISDTKTEEDKDVNVCPKEESVDVEPSTSTDNSKEVGNKRPTCKRTNEEMTNGSLKAQSKRANCKLRELQARGPDRQRRGAVFWPYGWRSELCTCTNCKRAYVAAEVQFLMDPSDTLVEYERRGLDEPLQPHLLTDILKFTSSRVQQLEVVYGLNELATSLNQFLQVHASKGKIVTADAMQEFFEEFRARKRRRTNTGYQ